MAKVKLKVDVEGNAKKKMDGVTASFIKGGLAVEGIKKATKALIDTAKKAIDSFIEQEKVEKQLETTLISTKEAAGLTANEIKAMATSFADLTNFTDQAILGSQNILLTFTKIGEEVFPRATETILDMSQALGSDLKGASIQLGKALNNPIVGISALAEVGVAFTEDQKAMVRQMQESGDIIGAQTLILKELEVEFGGSAKAARQTFGGALKSLETNQNELLESGGRILGFFGTDLVNSMAVSSKSVNDFISSTKVLATTGSTFEVIKNIGSDIATDVFEGWKTQLKPIINLFSGLNSKVSVNIDILSTLSKVMGVISLAYGTVSGAVGLTIQGFIDFIKIGKDVVMAAGSIGQALTGKISFKEAKENILGLGDSFKNLKNNATANFFELVDNVKLGVGELFADGVEGTDKYSKLWKDTYQGIVDTVENSNNDIISSEEDKNNALNEGANETEKTIKKSISAFSQLKNFTGGAFNEMADSVGSFSGILGGTFKKTLDLISSEAATTKEKVLGSFAAIAEGIAQSMSAITDIINAGFEQQREARQANLESQIETLNEETEAKLAALGFGTEADIANAVEKANELAAIAAAETDTEKKKEAQEAALRAKAEADRLKVLKVSSDKEEKLKDQARKKENAEKKKQFEINKGLAIANIWLNAAAAVLGFWAAFAGMGIPGLVLAGVATAAVLILAGVQTGLVASQNPGFQEGGVIPGNSLTGDRVQINANSAERVLTSRQNTAFEEMVFGGQGEGGSIIINGDVFVNADDVDSFRESLIEQSRFEKAR